MNKMIVDEAKYRFLTTKEMAFALRVVPGTFSRIAKTKKIPYTRIGGQKLYRQEDLDRLIEENTYPKRHPQPKRLSEVSCE